MDLMGCVCTFVHITYDNINNQRKGGRELERDQGLEVDMEGVRGIRWSRWE